MFQSTNQYIYRYFYYFLLTWDAHRLGKRGRVFLPLSLGTVATQKHQQKAHQRVGNPTHIHSPNVIYGIPYHNYARKYLVIVGRDKVTRNDM